MFVINEITCEKIVIHYIIYKNTERYRGRGNLLNQSKEIIRLKKNTRNTLLLLVTMLLLASWLRFVMPKSVKLERESYKLGTVVRLTVYGTDEAILEKTANDVMEEITRYENIFSVNIPTSEISKINDAPQTNVRVSTETVDAITDSLKFAEETDGMFDPTIGPIVRLWRIGTEYARVPEKEEIDKALSYVDYKEVSVKGNMVRTGEKQKLDLGGIAKGWITDRLTEKLKKDGIHSALIDLGGNIAVIGKAPKGPTWRLGLQHPNKSRGEYFAVVNAMNTSVVTSGPYERFFEKNNVRYHHIFDPFSGYPANSDLASVTIVSKNSGQADALCTALFVMGQKKSLEFLDAHKDIQAVLVAKDAKKVFLTAGLKNSITIKDTSMTVEVIGDFKN